MMMTIMRGSRSQSYYIFKKKIDMKIFLMWAKNNDLGSLRWNFSEYWNCFDFFKISFNVLLMFFGIFN